ncbi:Aminopeptidase Y [Minicystis rosea]|nr:Aminopeptidase Y [Minicystis rosea]
MMIVEAKGERPAAPAQIDEQELRDTVSLLSVRRHRFAQAAENRRVGERIAMLLADLGYRVSFQGQHRNVVATPPDAAGRSLTLVCAHYDSVPGTPGADDNASGVAGLLAAARALAGRGAAVGFVAFNGEEDGMIGSADFVTALREQGAHTVRAAHVLEMIGFTAHRRGSQRSPINVPLSLPDVGDFIGLLGNAASNALVDTAVRVASRAVPDLRVIGLKTYFGIDRFLPVLHRSDHAPFWQAGIPAVLWTDTAEFRNPHYHASTDLPATLDYAFMRRVTELVVAAASEKTTSV